MKKQLFFLIFKLFIFIASEHNKYLSKICTLYSEGSKDIEFKDYASKKTFTWNVFQALSKSRKIGAGSFGKVYSVRYPGSANRDERIALKKISPKPDFPMNLIASEIIVSIQMNGSPGSPKFYGCVYDVSNAGLEFVYIASEKMDTHLRDSIFRSYIRTLDKIEKLKLVRNLFDALRFLWNLGYVHNDIKPENMMTTKDKSKLVLIDYGLTQKKSEKKNRNGSPMYMSPGKLKPDGKAYSEMDDQYSLALSISEIFAEKIDDAFTDPITNQIIEKTCHSKENTPSCQVALRLAAISVLTPLFGPYQMPDIQKDYPNLTTLVADLILYNDKTVSYEKSIATIDKMINILDQETAPRISDNEKKQRFQNEKELLENLKTQYHQLCENGNSIANQINQLTVQFRALSDQIEAIKKKEGVTDTLNQINALLAQKAKIKENHDVLKRQRELAKKQILELEQEIMNFRNKDVMRSQMIQENKQQDRAYYENDQNEVIKYAVKDALKDNNSDGNNEQIKRVLMAEKAKNGKENAQNQGLDRMKHEDKKKEQLKGLKEETKNII